MSLTPRTLRQQLALFVLFPVALLLLSMGAAGFLFARNKLLDQWGEAAMLRLQRAAHQVDMRLDMPKIWLNLYQKTYLKPYAGWVQNDIIHQLEAVDGVSRVILHPDTLPPPGAGLQPGGGAAPPAADPPSIPMTIPMHGIRIEVSPSCRNSCDADLTVSLIADLKNAANEPAGSLEVVMPFAYLIETVKTSGWWQSNEAFLVDQSGRILAATAPEGRRQLGESGDPIEQQAYEALKERSLGIVFGPGFPVSKVIGFYRLQEAPWSLVMIAPAKDILGPVISFRNYYFLIGLTTILCILLLIRWATGKTVSAIKEVSVAAGKLAEGDFSQSLPVKSRDEVGELTASFNAMARQLEERIRLKASLNLAKEVQQNLLPQASVRFCGLEIAGKILYCDETGGDYYDFMRFQELGEGRIGIAVGDVADHGISAALLMTTARALLRSRITQPGTLSQVVGDVNRLLGVDTAQSGNFMTMFVMVIDCRNRWIQWVRAGHDAAEVYDAGADTFQTLDGTGLALGVDDAWHYEEYQAACCAGNEIILIGTDGIWETENPAGERFGKERLRRIIRQYHHASAGELIDAVLSEVSRFRQTSTQADDITLVVIKTDNCC